jgi:hypothetical protein
MRQKAWNGLGAAVSSSAWLLQSGFRQVRNIADRNDDALALEMAPAERIPLRLNASDRNEPLRSGRS